MDETKRISRLKKYLKYYILGIIFLLSAYSLTVYLTLPSIENINNCFTTAMFKVELCAKSSRYVPIQNIPKLLIQSLVMAEDASFYSHQGLDWFEIKESFRRNWEEGRIARGGSTLTQQLAKNLYLSGTKSLGRKIQEYFLAKRIEEKLSKSQIIEKYFNVVEFGEDIYGIKQAANHYFAKYPDNLNLLEDVYLVSLLPNPKGLGKSYNNKNLSKANLWRMKIVLRRLYRTNKISEAIYLYSLNLLETQTWPFPIFNEFEGEQFELASGINEDDPYRSINDQDDSQDLDDETSASTGNYDIPETDDTSKYDVPDADFRQPEELDINQEPPVRDLDQPEEAEDSIEDIPEDNF